MVLLDTATSVARSGFTKLVLYGSHGGNVGNIDDYFRDLRLETGMHTAPIRAAASNSDEWSADSAGAGSIFPSGVGNRPSFVMANSWSIS